MIKSFPGSHQIGALLSSAAGIAIVFLSGNLSRAYTPQESSTEISQSSSSASENSAVSIKLTLIPSAPAPEAPAEPEKVDESKPPVKIALAPSSGPARRSLRDIEPKPSLRIQPADADRVFALEPVRDGDPGDPGDSEPISPLPVQPGDIPLVEDSHPFDAPAAESTEKSTSPNREAHNSEPPMSATTDERNMRIDAVLEYYRTHPENTVKRGPWALMHTILPYGVEAEVMAGTQKVNTIGWLCHNGIAAKQRIFQPTQTGFRTNVGPGVQGHEGQFLAILAQSHVNPNYPIKIGKKSYTIHDLIRYEMAGCREKTELTFKLIAFTHYLEPDQKWRDNRGRTWNIEKLVAEELAQPINGQACGGTHRLMGLTCAVVSRQEAGLPLTGHFHRAEQFLNDYVEYTFSLQNPDGSFSTEWFERRANEPNVERKVQTTGHILEWLVYTLPDNQLDSPEIEKAIDFLLDSIGKDPDRNWPIGPRGHALRSMVLYQKRVCHNLQLDSAANLRIQPFKSPKRR